jgi:hypothetical protein
MYSCMCVYVYYIFYVLICICLFKIYSDIGNSICGKQNKFLEQSELHTLRNGNQIHF